MALGPVKRGGIFFTILLVVLVPFVITVLKSIPLPGAGLIAAVATLGLFGIVGVLAEVTLGGRYGRHLHFVGHLLLWLAVTLVPTALVSLGFLFFVAA